MKRKELSYLSVIFLGSLFLTGCNGQPITSDEITKDLFGSWQAFVIQIVASLLMMLLVGRLLVKPVRKMLSDRQEYVEKQISDADNAKLEAEKTKNDLDEQLKNVHVQAKGIIDEAKKNADEIKVKATNEIEEEKVLQRELLKKQLEQEKIKAKEEIRKEIVSVALDASSAVLEREVKKEDNEKIINNFIKEVESDE